MQAQEQQGCREHHHVVDAERIHGAAGERHVAVDAGVLDLLAQAVLMRDAAAHALIAQAEIAVHAVGRSADAVAVEVQRVIAHHRILDVLHHLVPRHGLDMVRVDVDDEPVLQLAPAGGEPGVLEDLAAVGRGVDDLGRQHLRHAGHWLIHGLLLATSPG